MCNTAVNSDSSFVRSCKVVFFSAVKIDFWIPMWSRDNFTPFRSQHFPACFSLQGALLVGRTPRRFQVLAPCWLLSVLRGPAAQREDAHWACQGVQEGPGGGPRPAGNHPVPITGLLHPHPSRHKSGRSNEVGSRTATAERLSNRGVTDSSHPAGCPPTSSGQCARQTGWKHSWAVGDEQDWTGLDFRQGKVSSIWLLNCL